MGIRLVNLVPIILLYRYGMSHVVSCSASSITANACRYGRMHCTTVTQPWALHAIAPRRTTLALRLIWRGPEGSITLWSFKWFLLIAYILSGYLLRLRLLTFHLVRRLPVYTQKERWGTPLITELLKYHIDRGDTIKRSEYQPWAPLSTSSPRL